MSKTQVKQQILAAVVALAAAGAMGGAAAAAPAGGRVTAPNRVLHSPDRRAATLVPSIAVAPRGRLWATWYGGASPREDHWNYVILATSDDDGATWREVWVADPDGDGPKRPFDPEIWLAPDGSLHWTWTERDGEDFATDTLWMLTLPDADTVPPAPPAPRAIANGVMMCKPTFLADGTWLLPVAAWRQEKSSGFYASTDNGATFQYRGGATMPADDRLFDEHMSVERRDGTLWCLSRCKCGLREAFSHDGGRTWSPLEHGRLRHTSSRFSISRLASGNLLLVKHGAPSENVGRKHLAAYVSTDDGQTWQGGLMLDARKGVSYPSVAQAADGTLYVAYDFDRYGARDILFAAFTEADALAGRPVSGKVRLRRPIAKGRGRGLVPGRVFPPDATHAADRRKHSSPASPVLTAPGGRQWKTWTAGPGDATPDKSDYGILAMRPNADAPWEEVLIADPDDTWPRRVESPSLALKNGRLEWRWTDIVKDNRSEAQVWAVELDPDTPPSTLVRRVYPVVN